ncbi:MAG: hypothetical protein EBR09_16255, partial [Proteobacteria bacterium]|nr:hypothetical protein [Pseudomonadota bacterium]
MSFSGSQASLNSALSVVVFRGNSNFNGTSALTITTSDLGSTGDGGILTDSDTALIQVTAVNDTPTLTNVSILTGATEDTFFEINYATLSAAADEYDVESANLTFRVESISTGTQLQKWDSLNSIWVNATPEFTVLSIGEKLQWKGATNANGVHNAFTIKAFDGVSTSTTPVQVYVNISPENDSPTLTNIATISGATEDTFLLIPFSTLATSANEFDVETPNPDFKIDAISTGSLEKWVGAGWTNVIPGTTTLSNGELLQWKAAVNANGILPAFTVRAQDGNGALSNAVQVNVDVAAVNDIPTLTNITTLTGVPEDNFHVITYSDLANAGDEADIETPNPSFRIEGVTASTTLEKWDGSGWTAASAGTTVIAAGEKVRWKGVSNSFGVLPAFSVKAFDGISASSTAVPVYIDISPVNDAPTLTTISTLTGAVEDTFFEITHNDLTAAANEADTETAALSFKIEAITAGTTLQKWDSVSGIWVNVTAGMTLLSVGEKLQWKGIQDSNGLINAFSVKAYDGSDASNTAVPVFISVTPINDNPTLTSVSTLSGAFEDTFKEISYGELAESANEADVETSFPSFKIESISAGTTLEKRIGLAWTPVIPGATIISSGERLQWKGNTNANGVLAAFTIVAFDGTGSSSTPVQVNIDVAPVNDAPTLSSISNLTGAVEDTFFVITYNDLAGVANEADVETADPSFRIETVTSGTTLEKWNGSTWVAAVTGTTLLASGETIRWKGAPNNFGILPAFAVRAWDGSELSVTTVMVNIDVASSNDIPTLSMISPLSDAVEDTFHEITYERLALVSNESDTETALPSFRIESVTAGTTLQKWDSISATWTSISAGSTLLSAGEKLQWKAALNANGVLPAFTVTAYDGTNASSTPVTVSVSVAAVNDIPTLSAITTLTSATEDTFKEITYGELAGAADEADVDSAAISFRIESITAGTTLEK